MKVIVSTSQGTKVYEQLFDDSKTLNATIGFLMEQPLGTQHTVKVENNGHEMTFATQGNPTPDLIKVANGFSVRSRSKAEAAV